jgi:MoaA/NifB/PqqE/SkfB family radical SAM enzyme
MLTPGSQLAVILTNRCNLRCRYCLRDSEIVREDEIPFEDLKEVLLTAHRVGYRSVGITGGEALLYSDLYKVIDLLGAMQWNVFLETNGLILQANHMERLTPAINERLEMMVSLDSHREEEHDRLRGRGSFAATIRAIEMIKSHGVTLQVNKMITPANMDTLYSLTEFMRFCRKLDVDRVSLSRVVELGRGLKHYMLSQSQSLQLRRILEETGGFGGYVCGHSFQYLDENRSCVRLQTRGICVSPQGVHPCIFMTDLVLGDLRDFERLMGGDFVDSLDALRSGSMTGTRHLIFSCPECKPHFQRYMKKLNSITG